MSFNVINSILFVCHGNICRSTMAQSVMTYLLNEANLTDIRVDSAGTSDEEEGNSVHYGTQSMLRRMNIPCVPHHARQITAKDGRDFDLLIGMDSANIRNMKRMLPEVDSSRIIRLLDLTNAPRDIADPWYTGDFQETFDDIEEGCTSLLEHLRG